MEKSFTHLNQEGKARMVDVSHKPDQQRIAVAVGTIKLSPETIRLIENDQIKKGNVLTLAEIAGIQAAKQTSQLIPLCHPLLLNKIEVNTSLTAEGVDVRAIVKCTGKTGVEMEALTAVSVALLTVYDMCKAVDQNMEIVNIRLIEKSKLD